MKNLAIIGASYLQLPLINKAKEMGYVTHVFAWKVNDVGEREADHFYPISITEKERILEKCREIGISGICSISSDLAAITVNYVANALNLTGNSIRCTEQSTNKHLMRKCFERNGDPSPKSILVDDIKEYDLESLDFPVIVKPLDRSGSRGITKVNDVSELNEAIERAKKEGFQKEALIEEFIQGEEFSVECISWEGKHQLLAVTKKFTSGPPSFIENGHMEPAMIDDKTIDLIRKTVYHALDSLEIRYGASHSEVKVDGDKIQIVEIGGRMGGDLIGSDLVYLSTGYDFVKAVIDVCVGKKPETYIKTKNNYVGVRFIFDRKDLTLFDEVFKNDRDLLVKYQIDYEDIDHSVTDSSNRHGYYIICSEEKEKIHFYMNK